MADPSEYDTAFQWTSVEDGESDDYAQPARMIEDKGVVWARWDVPSSNRQPNVGTAPTNTTYGTAFVRELLSIKTGDTLTDLELDIEYEVVSVAKDRAANETVCELKGLR